MEEDARSLGLGRGWLTSLGATTRTFSVGTVLGVRWFTQVLPSLTVPPFLCHTKPSVQSCLCLQFSASILGSSVPPFPVSSLPAQRVRNLDSIIPSMFPCPALACFCYMVLLPASLLGFGGCPTFSSCSNLTAEGVAC